MALLGDFVVKIGANITQLERGLKRAQAVSKKFADDLTGIGRTLTASLSLPLAGIGAAAIKMSSDMEQSKIAFETLAGGATEATRLLQNLFDFALETPFTFVGLQESSKRLIAMGFKAEQIIPTMRAVGDAVAAVGGGQDVINRVTLALGQMQAKGKVSAEEMRQLAEAGIPAWELLANVLNTTVQDAMNQVQKRAVNSGTAIQGLLSQMGKRFSGLMKKQTGTVLGSFSIFRDQLNKILIDIGDDLNKAFKITDKIKSLTNFVKILDERLLDLSDTTKTLGFSFLAAVTVIGPFLIGMALLITLGSAVAGSLGIAISTVGALVAGFLGLSTATIAIASDWEKFKKSTIKVWKNIKLGILIQLEGIISGLKTFVRALAIPTGALDDLQAKITSGISDITIKPKIQIDDKAIGDILAKFKSAKDKFKKEAGSSLDSFGITLPVINKELPVILKQLQKDLALAADKNKLLGDSFDFSDNKASLLKSAIEDLLKAGVSPANPEILKLSERLKNLGIATKEIKEPLDSVGITFSTMQDKLARATELFGLLGTTFSFNENRASILKDAMINLLDQGISPADPQLLALRDRLLEVQKAMDTTKTKLVILKSSFENGFQQIGKAATQFAKSLAVNLLTGANAWKSILNTFFQQAVSIIVDAAFAAMGIAKLVSTAMSQMFNPLGFIIIGGLLVALASISSGFGAKQASVAAGGGGGTSDTIQADIPEPSQPQNIVIINGNLVDLAQLSRELEDFNIELVRDQI